MNSGRSAKIPRTKHPSAQAFGCRTLNGVPDEFQGDGMWYLNETNTETVKISDVKAGDTITMSTEPRHGFKVHRVRNSRKPGKREIIGSGLRLQMDPNTKVLRLLKNPDGTAMCATNR